MRSICEQLDAYLGSDLPPLESVRFKDHLRDCAACAAETLRQRQLDRLLMAAKARPEPVPHPLQVRVERMLEGPAQATRRMPAWVHWSPLAAAAALLFVIGWGWIERAAAPRGNARTAQELSVAKSDAAVGSKPVRSQEALARLALLATERRTSTPRPGLAWLGRATFPEAGSVVLVQPVLNTRKPKADPEENAEEEDGPKSGKLPRFNALSVESVQTLGERRLDRVFITPSDPLKKEDIPCQSL